MRCAFHLAFAFLLTLSLSLKAAPWQAPAGLKQEPLWPSTIPDATTAARPEDSVAVTDKPVAGKPWTVITDVAAPTMTVYPAKGENTSVAVVIFPGGGYEILAIDLEGTEFAEWLSGQGITAIVCKYRVPMSGPFYDEKNGGHDYTHPPQALEDAQRTIRLVRHRAAEWKIDPHKIGVLGFSAGGHVVAGTSTRFDEKIYAPVDDADKESARPDFAIAAYPGHLWANEDDERAEAWEKPLTLRSDLRVTAQTPPTFIVQSSKDPTDTVGESLAYYLALTKAGVSVEMHLFAQGGHAFGLRRTELPVTHWTDLLLPWLRASGIVKAP